MEKGAIAMTDRCDVTDLAEAKALAVTTDALIQEYDVDH